MDSRFKIASISGIDARRWCEIQRDRVVCRDAETPNKFAEKGAEPNLLRPPNVTGTEPRFGETL
jgi:hypothetical protein